MLNSSTKAILSTTLGHSKRQWYALLILLILGNAPGSASDDDASVKLYVPFATQPPATLRTQVQRLLNESIHAPNKVIAVTEWSEYLRAVRTGSPGLYLAAPHFVSWLVHRHDATPLARFDEMLSYTVLSRAGDHGLFDLSDLSGRVVCTQPSMNLDFLMVSNIAADEADSITIAVTRSIAQRLRDRDQRCDAFTVSNHLASEVEESDAGEFVRLTQSKQWPQYALVVIDPSSDKPKQPMVSTAVAVALLKLLQPQIAHEAQEQSVVPAARSDYPLDLSNMLLPYW